MRRAPCGQFDERIRATAGDLRPPAQASSCGYASMPSSSSVTRAATGERSERVSVTWANNG